MSDSINYDLIYTDEEITAFVNTSAEWKLNWMEQVNALRLAVSPVGDLAEHTQSISQSNS